MSLWMPWISFVSFKNNADLYLMGLFISFLCSPTTTWANLRHTSDTTSASCEESLVKQLAWEKYLRAHNRLLGNDNPDEFRWGDYFWSVLNKLDSEPADAPILQQILQLMAEIRTYPISERHWVPK